MKGMASGTGNAYRSIGFSENQSSTFPPEIVLLILENLRGDYSTVSSLSIGNKFLHQACQPLLYHSVYGNVGEQKSTRKNGNRALLAIMKNLHLGQHVVKFSLHSPIGHRSADVGQYLGPVLRSMVNLKHLSVESYSAENWKLLDFTQAISQARIPSEEIPLAPFQLESFSWIGHSRSSSSCSFEHLTSFLNTQQHLRRVEAQLDGLKNYHTVANTGIRRSRPQKPIPKSACPKLQWVAGNRAAVEALLPGRNITVLEWKPDWSDPRGNIAFLSRELSRLKVLSLHDPGWLGTPAPTLEMAEYLYSLEYLEVHNMVGVQFLKLGFYYLTHIPTVQDLDSLGWIGNLVSLLGLVILDDRNRYRPSNMSNRRDKIANFFVECPKLRFIAVELPSTFKFNFEWWGRSGLDIYPLGQDSRYEGQWEPERHVRYSDLEKLVYPSQHVNDII